MNDLLFVFRKLVADLWLPKSLVAVGVSVLDYALPEQSRSMAVAAFALVVLDTFTGFWASLTTGRRISSARFSRVLTKLLGYGSVVVVCAVASHMLSAGLQPAAVSGVLAFVTLTEGISILENVGRMGVKAPPFLLAWLRKRLASTEDSHENSTQD